MDTSLLYFAVCCFSAGSFYCTNFPFARCTFPHHSTVRGRVQAYFGKSFDWACQDFAKAMQ